MTTVSNEALVRVRDLTKLYPVRETAFWRARGSVRAVNGVSFDVRPGEVLGLAGETGSGKTTIGRSVLRLIEPTSGSVMFQGRDVLRFGSRELRAFRRDAQIVFQDPYASLDPRMSVEAILREPLQLQQLHAGRREQRERVAELLGLVGLSSDYASRLPAALSGGQRQRVGIARALAVNPSFIVADEPVSALDVSVQAQVINLLADLRARLGLAILFISHDIAVMRYLSDRIAVLYLGKIMEIGPARDLCANPQHPYTEALLSDVPEPDPSARRKRIVLHGELPDPGNPPSGCVFRTRCHRAIPECAQVVPELKSTGADRAVACIRV